MRGAFAFKTNCNADLLPPCLGSFSRALYHCKTYVRLKWLRFLLSCSYGEQDQHPTDGAGTHGACTCKMNWNADRPLFQFVLSGTVCTITKHILAFDGIGLNFCVPEVDNISIPPDGAGTPDQYPVGDLSGKYGSLAGKDNVFAHLLDPTLPLSGPESIMGRILIAYGSDQTPLVCVNVLPVGVQLVRARATFEGTLRGSVTIAQDQGDPLDDAYIDVGICWTGSLHTAATVDHPWHVHERALAQGSFDCVSAGRHYDPHMVSHQNRTFVRAM